MDEICNHLASIGFEGIILSSKGNVDSYYINKKIDLHLISSRYPKVLSRSRLSIIQKTIYKLAVLQRKLIYKGSVYDKGKGLEKLLIKKINTIIEKRCIDNIIVSGAPFSFLYFITKHYKNKINIICDFRDPWTWGIGYGMTSLSKKRMEYEKMCEKKVLKNSNFILCASQDLAKVLNLKLKLFNKKSVVLINALEQIKPKINDDFYSNNKDKIIISHIGTVALQTEKYWNTFLKFLNSSKHNIVLNVYGNSNFNFDSFVKNSSFI